MGESYADGINLRSKEDTPQQILEESFFNVQLDFFDETPFEVKVFETRQSFLLQKVKEALDSMKEDIEDTLEGADLLISTFQISAWETLIEQLDDSIKSISNEDDLRKKIFQCAVTFYKELMDPKRSIQQLDYLLHMRPYEPQHWGAYALCLIEMSEQCMPSSFDMEKRSVICFVRGARLSIAHLLADDKWLKENGREKAIRLAQEYYYNASDAYPNHVARKGIFLVKMLKATGTIPAPLHLKENKTIYEEEDLTREIREILELKISP